MPNTRIITLVTVIIAAFLFVSTAGATGDNGNGGGHTPVTICHKPDGANPHTITVDDNAVPAHLAHGDTIGECPAEPEPTEVVPEPTEVVTVPDPTEVVVIPEPTDVPIIQPEPTHGPVDPVVPVDPGQPLEPVTPDDQVPAPAQPGQQGPEDTDDGTTPDAPDSYNNGPAPDDGTDRGADRPDNTAATDRTAGVVVESQPADRAADREVSAFPDAGTGPAPATGVKWGAAFIGIALILIAAAQITLIDSRRR